jgi:hypothetical protein
MAALHIDVRPEPDKNRHHPDGIDCNEDRDESNEEFGHEVSHRVDSPSPIANFQLPNGALQLEVLLHCGK